MMKFVFLYLFVLIFASASSMANTRSIKILRDKLSNQSNKVNKLAAQIKDIDSRISHSNDSYVERMKEIDGIEEKIEQVKQDLVSSAQNISEQYVHTKLAFDHYLLEATDSTSEDNFYSKKVYMELLQTKLSDLKEAQKNSNVLLSSLNTIEQILTNKKKDEESIYQLIVELENSKREYGQSYISMVENKNLVQAKLDKVMVKKKAVRKVYRKNSKHNARVLFTMGLPIDNFVKADTKQEGITFQYSTTTPIKAPRSGKVVYSGELASYGNVLIIDHGNDVRSVLLGDIVSKVAKGDMVSHNQIVGYTLADQGNLKSLYYEIRKKDIAQNTIKWVSKTDKKQLKI